MSFTDPDTLAAMRELVGDRLVAATDALGEFLATNRDSETDAVQDAAEHLWSIRFDLGLTGGKVRFDAGADHEESGAAEDATEPETDGAT
ncbi:MAG TPA: hypothetical protein VF989_21435 [Polyangiaceae bacterium]